MCMCGGHAVLSRREVTRRALRSDGGLQGSGTRRCAARRAARRACGRELVGFEDEPAHEKAHTLLCTAARLLPRRPPPRLALQGTWRCRTRGYAQQPRACTHEARATQLRRHRGLHLHGARGARETGLPAAAAAAAAAAVAAAAAAA